MSWNSVLEWLRTAPLPPVPDHTPPPTPLYLSLDARQQELHRKWLTYDSNAMSRIVMELEQRIYELEQAKK